MSNPFQRLGRSLADDLLADDSDEEVDEILQAAGGDPAAIGRRGAEHAARTLKRQRNMRELGKLLAEGQSQPPMQPLGTRPAPVPDPRLLDLDPYGENDDGR